MQSSFSAGDLSRLREMRAAIDRYSPVFPGEHASDARQSPLHQLINTLKDLLDSVDDKDAEWWDLAFQRWESMEIGYAMGVRGRRALSEGHLLEIHEALSGLREVVDDSLSQWENGSIKPSSEGE